MRRLKWSITVVAGAALFVSSLAGIARAEDSTDPLKFVLNDWTGQLLSAHIMGEALKREKYKVDYVQADPVAQFQGLETGDLDVTMEVWATVQKDAFDEALKTGMVENLGETGMKAREEWWFPEYMKEKCPGLPDWKALLEPACVEAFSTPDTAPKGRYLGGPVTWGGYDEERIAALGLDFDVVHAGTDAALFAELESAYRRKAPILLWLYAPHWAPSLYEGEWVEFPPYTPECYSEQKYNCGKPYGPIWKAAWSGVKTKWPKAHDAISKFSIETEEMNALIAKVDLDKQTVEDVTNQWLDENEARWRAWFD